MKIRSLKKHTVKFVRQKILLALLQAFGGHLQRQDLQKYLFLFAQSCKVEKSYEFVPYLRGCYSFQATADLQRLTEVGIISSDMNSWKLADDRINYVFQLPPEEQNKLHKFEEKFRRISGNCLVKYVYLNYPYYAINSILAKDLMTVDELSVINEIRNVDNEYAFFTIGYEGQSFEHYLNRLVKNNVKILCDVRKNPHSRKFGFSKLTLSNVLKKLKIEYINFPELGIVSDKRQKLESQTDYDRLFNEYETSTLKQNDAALDKLERLFLDHKRVAITCFEADHRKCHRSRVASAMKTRPDWTYRIIDI